MGYYGAKSFIALRSIPYRPPQLRCAIFPSIYLPHLLNISSDSYWASVCLATLPDIPSLICDFCPSDQRFAIRLPSDSTSRWTPLPSAVSFPLSGHSTDFHRLDYAHAGRTKKSSHPNMDESVCKCLCISPVLSTGAEVSFYQFTAHHI